MEVIKSAIREASGQRLDLRRECGRLAVEEEGGEGNLTNMQGNCSYNVTFVEVNTKFSSLVLSPLNRTSQSKICSRRHKATFRFFTKFLLCQYPSHANMPYREYLVAEPASVF